MAEEKLTTREGSKNILLRTEVRGDRRIYYYQMPDGTTKQVYKKINPSNAANTKKQNIQDKNAELPAGQKGNGNTKTEVTREDEEEPTDGDNLSAYKKLEDLLNKTDIWERSEEEESKTGISLKWIVFTNSEDSSVEMFVLEGEKFRISLIESSKSDEELNVIIHVDDKINNKTLYERGLHFTTEFFQEPEKFIQQITFLVKRPEAYQKVVDIASLVKDFDKLVNLLKYGLELSYFKKRGTQGGKKAQNVDQGQ
jgi:hypothetical protein